MECVRQDEGDGGKLWGAMRPHKASNATSAGSASSSWGETQLLWLVLIIIKIP